ncbi:LptF/LptG family permease [Desulfovibrio sp. OttesenSCG-928-C14]|nr:LptF/LptG family permease [Desulfovibrio sp. OttesenSCG-928-C14]
MTILSRYLLRRNLFLLMALLCLGVGIFILADLFQRIDVFMDAGYGFGGIAAYFVLRAPMIASMILPVIFLLALVIQLGLMRKSRETVALEAGGISPGSMVRFIMVYGLAFSLLQFALSQFIGVYGEEAGNRIWREDVRGRSSAYYAIQNLWFTHGPYVVYLERALPEDEAASGVYIYELNPDGLSINKVYQAARAETGPKSWRLHEARVLSPESFDYESAAELSLPVGMELALFRNFEPKAPIAERRLGEIISSIESMEKAGTNVELLRTELHKRFAFSASLFIMGLLALVITMLTVNIYVAVILSLISTFLYYAASVFCATLGESGNLAPFWAAWLPNTAFFLLSGGYILLQYLRTLRHKL